MKGLFKRIALIKYGSPVTVETLSKTRHFLQDYNIFVAKQLLGITGSIRGETRGWWQEYLKALMPVEWAVWKDLVVNNPEKIKTITKEEFLTLVKEYLNKPEFAEYKKLMEDAKRKILELASALSTKE